MHGFMYFSVQATPCILNTRKKYFFSVLTYIAPTFVTRVFGDTLVNNKTV